MQRMKGRIRLATVALAAIVAVVAGGCSGDGAGSDKAGGAGEPVVMARGGSGWASSKRDWSRASARNGEPAGRWDVNRDSDAESNRR